MSFDQSAITSVDPPTWGPAGLTISWETTAPSGTVFQVYVGGALAKATTAHSATVPYPGDEVRIDVGAVAAGEAQVDFSASLPSLPLDRAVLSWLGGTYLDPSGAGDVEGFRIYGEPTPGGGIDYQHPLDQVEAYSGGVITDGFGLGGFGQGGFGQSASSYTWTSGPLTSGTWNFAVVSFDAAGNEGTPQTAAIAIDVAPRPVAPNSSGRRLTYAYDPASRTVTISWLPSPDEPSAAPPSTGSGFSLMGMI